MSDITGDLALLKEEFKKINPNLSDEEVQAVM